MTYNSEAFITTAKSFKGTGPEEIKILGVG
jgi:hypothetical protein